jgi:hypothetical protein
MRIGSCTVAPEKPNSEIANPALSEAAEYLPKIPKELSGRQITTWGEETRNLAIGAFKELQS